MLLGRQHIPYLGILLEPIFTVTWKLAPTLRAPLLQEGSGLCLNDHTTGTPVSSLGVSLSIEDTVASSYASYSDP